MLLKSQRFTVSGAMVQIKLEYPSVLQCRNIPREHTLPSITKYHLAPWPSRSLFKRF